MTCNVFGGRVAPQSGSLSLGQGGSGSEADERVAKRCSGSRFDDLIDPSSTPEERRRQRRMLSNRESARRSRRRKENFLQVHPEPHISRGSSFEAWHDIRPAQGTVHDPVQAGESHHACGRNDLLIVVTVPLHCMFNQKNLSIELHTRCM